MIDDAYVFFLLMYPSQGKHDSAYTANNNSIR